TGGAEAYLLRLSKAIAEEGHLPMLVTSREWPEKEWPNDFVVRLNATSPLRFAEEVQRAAVGCDVVFSLERIFSCDVYRAGDGVHRAWLERRAAFEPAWRRSLRWLNGKHRSLLKLESDIFSSNGARCVIANSEMVRNEIVKSYNYPASRIEVIPNGYDPPPHSAGSRERRRAELGIAPDAFVALFAGSGWERKGLSAAVRAVREVDGITLLVAGRGNPAPYRNAREVLFLGPRAELQPDFAAADVFILPTIYDPFSNACLEAWASGLPVITTSANGFAEVLTDGDDGTVVSPGDINALAAALRFWKTDEKAAVTRGVCRERAMRYSVAENMSRTLDVIRRAVQK
ncbi:MAG: glycosyltransferase family 4 protein, partial [Chthoniobacterales bacterium]